MGCLNVFPEAWLQLGSLLDQRSQLISWPHTHPLPPTSARLQQLFLLHFFRFQIVHCPGLRDCTIPYGFSMPFIKLPNVCVSSPPNLAPE